MKTRKFLAVLLSLAMTLSLLPVGVFATEPDPIYVDPYGKVQAASGQTADNIAVYKKGEGGDAGAFAEAANTKKDDPENEGQQIAKTQGDIATLVSGDYSEKIVGISLGDSVAATDVLVAIVYDDAATEEDSSVESATVVDVSDYLYLDSKTLAVTALEDGAKNTQKIKVEDLAGASGNTVWYGRFSADDLKTDVDTFVGRYSGTTSGLTKIDSTENIASTGVDVTAVDGDIIVVFEYNKKSQLQGYGIIDEAADVVPDLSLTATFSSENANKPASADSDVAVTFENTTGARMDSVGVSLALTAPASVSQLEWGFGPSAGDAVYGDPVTSGLDSAVEIAARDVSKDNALFVKVTPASAYKNDSAVEYKFTLSKATADILSGIAAYKTGDPSTTLTLYSGTLAGASSDPSAPTVLPQYVVVDDTGLITNSAQTPIKLTVSAGATVSYDVNSAANFTPEYETDATPATEGEENTTLLLSGDFSDKELNTLYLKVTSSAGANAYYELPIIVTGSSTYEPLSTIAAGTVEDEHAQVTYLGGKDGAANYANPKPVALTLPATDPALLNAVAVKLALNQMAAASATYYVKNDSSLSNAEDFTRVYLDSNGYIAANAADAQSNTAAKYNFTSGKFLYLKVVPDTGAPTYYRISVNKTGDDKLDFTKVAYAAANLEYTSGTDKAAVEQLPAYTEFLFPVADTAGLTGETVVLSFEDFVIGAAKYGTDLAALKGVDPEGGANATIANSASGATVTLTSVANLTAGTYIKVWPENTSKEPTYYFVKATSDGVNTFGTATMTTYMFDMNTSAEGAKLPVTLSSAIANDKLTTATFVVTGLPAGVSVASVEGVDGYGNADDGWTKVNLVLTGKPTTAVNTATLATLKVDGKDAASNVKVGTFSIETTKQALTVMKGSTLTAEATKLDVKLVTGITGAVLTNTATAYTLSGVDNVLTLADNTTKHPADVTLADVNKTAQLALTGATVSGEDEATGTFTVAATTAAFGGENLTYLTGATTVANEDKNSTITVGNATAQDIVVFAGKPIDNTKTVTITLPEGVAFKADGATTASNYTFAQMDGEQLTVNSAAIKAESGNKTIELTLQDDTLTKAMNKTAVELTIKEAALQGSGELKILVNVTVASATLDNAKYAVLAGTETEFTLDVTLNNGLKFKDDVGEIEDSDTLEKIKVAAGSAVSNGSNPEFAITKLTIKQGQTSATITVQTDEENLTDAAAAEAIAVSIQSGLLDNTAEAALLINDASVDNAMTTAANENAMLKVAKVQLDTQNSGVFALVDDDLEENTNAVVKLKLDDASGVTFTDVADAAGKIDLVAYGDLYTPEQGDTLTDANNFAVASLTATGEDVNLGKTASAKLSGTVTKEDQAHYAVAANTENYKFTVKIKNAEAFSAGAGYTLKFPTAGVTVGTADDGLALELRPASGATVTLTAPSFKMDGTFTATISEAYDKNSVKLNGATKYDITFKSDKDGDRNGATNGELVFGEVAFTDGAAAALNLGTLIAAGITGQRAEIGDRTLYLSKFVAHGESTDVIDLTNVTYVFADHSEYEETTVGEDPAYPAVTVKVTPAAINKIEATPGTVGTPSYDSENGKTVSTLTGVKVYFKTNDAAAEPVTGSKLIVYLEQDVADTSVAYVDGQSESHDITATKVNVDDGDEATNAYLFPITSNNITLDEDENGTYYTLPALTLTNTQNTDTSVTLKFKYVEGTNVIADDYGEGLAVSVPGDERAATVTLSKTTTEDEGVTGYTAGGDLYLHVKAVKNLNGDAVKGTDGVEETTETVKVYILSNKENDAKRNTTGAAAADFWYKDSLNNAPYTTLHHVDNEHPENNKYVAAVVDVALDSTGVGNAKITDNVFWSASTTDNARVLSYVIYDGSDELVPAGKVTSTTTGLSVSAGKAKSMSFGEGEDAAKITPAVNTNDNGGTIAVQSAPTLLVKDAFGNPVTTGKVVAKAKTSGDMLVSGAAQEKPGTPATTTASEANVTNGQAAFSGTNLFLANFGTTEQKFQVTFTYRGDLATGVTSLTQDSAEFTLLPATQTTYKTFVKLTDTAKEVAASDTIEVAVSAAKSMNRVGDDFKDGDSLDVKVTFYTKADKSAQAQKWDEATNVGEVAGKITFASDASNVLEGKLTIASEALTAAKMAKAGTYYMMVTTLEDGDMDLSSRIDEAVGYAQSGAPYVEVTVNPATASKLAVTTPAATTFTVNYGEEIENEIKVTATDAYNNPVTNQNLTVSIKPIDGIDFDYTEQDTADGVATFAADSIQVKNTTAADITKELTFQVESAQLASTEAFKIKAVASANKATATIEKDATTGGITVTIAPVYGTMNKDESNVTGYVVFTDTEDSTNVRKVPATFSFTAGNVRDGGTAQAITVEKSAYASFDPATYAVTVEIEGINGFTYPNEVKVLIDGYTAEVDENSKSIVKTIGKDTSAAIEIQLLKNKENETFATAGDATVNYTLDSEDKTATAKVSQTGLVTWTISELEQGEFAYTITSVVVGGQTYTAGTSAQATLTVHEYTAELADAAAQTIRSGNATYTVEIQMDGAETQDKVTQVTYTYAEEDDTELEPKTLTSDSATITLAYDPGTTKILTITEVKVDDVTATLGTKKTATVYSNQYTAALDDNANVIADMAEYYDFNIVVEDGPKTGADLNGKTAAVTYQVNEIAERTVNVTLNAAGKGTVKIPVGVFMNNVFMNNMKLTNTVTLKAVAIGGEAAKIDEANSEQSVTQMLRIGAMNTGTIDEKGVGTVKFGILGFGPINGGTAKVTYKINDSTETKIATVDLSVSEVQTGESTMSPFGSYKFTVENLKDNDKVTIVEATYTADDDAEEVEVFPISGNVTTTMYLTESTAPTITLYKDESGDAYIEITAATGAEIKYTLETGDEPTASETVYDDPIKLPEGLTSITATATETGKATSAAKLMIPTFDVTTKDTIIEVTMNKGSFENAWVIVEYDYGTGTRAKTVRALTQAAETIAFDAQSADVTGYRVYVFNEKPDFSDNENYGKAIIVNLGASGSVVEPE